MIDADLRRPTPAVRELKAYFYFYLNYDLIPVQGDGRSGRVFKPSPSEGEALQPFFFVPYLPILIHPLSLCPHPCPPSQRNSGSIWVSSPLLRCSQPQSSISLSLSSPLVRGLRSSRGYVNKSAGRILLGRCRWRGYMLWLASRRMSLTVLRYDFLSHPPPPSLPLTPLVGTLYASSWCLILVFCSLVVRRSPPLRSLFIPR